VSNFEFIIKVSYSSVFELLETFVINSAITTICFVLFSRNQNRVSSVIIVAYLLCVWGTVSLGDVNLDLSLQLPLITVFVAYWNLNRIQNKYWALLIAGVLHSAPVSIRFVGGFRSNLPRMLYYLLRADL